jgi:NADH-quinone oxidoreductase subunit C
MNNLIIQKLKTQFPNSIESTNDFRDDLTIQVRKSDIVSVAQYLKNDAELAFDLPIDVVGVDMYRPEGRFEVVYIMYSTKNQQYLRLKVLVGEDDATMPSLSSVWSGAAWNEREVYDMIGVKFSGHPDLRRMYMPEEFEYHPLRKDFPTMGIPDSLPLPRK